MMRETHTLQIRLTSSLMMVVGAWAALAPLFLSVSGGALWIQVIAGLALFVFGATQMVVESTLPSWVAAIAAIALIVTPFAAALSSGTFWNEMVTGIVALGLSSYDGYEVTQDQPQHSTA